MCLHLCLMCTWCCIWGLLLRDILYGFLASDAGGGDKDGFLPLLRGAANHTTPYHANHTIPHFNDTTPYQAYHTNDTKHTIPTESYTNDTTPTEPAAHASTAHLAATPTHDSTAPAAATPWNEARY